MTADLLLCYYGDDFTGSTDVMEALSANGAPTVLFTRTPSDMELAEFADFRAIGVAGESRSRPPDWMDKNLPAVFSWLRELGARHCHYKICSTFDSAPSTGSIGRAMEIGLDVFEQASTSLIVGAPQLRRYTLFGQLFAAFRDEVYRIDRHPVMSRHPATPMREADLRLHLSAQCGLQVGCLDPDMLRASPPREAHRRRRAAGDRAILIDVYDDASQQRAGALLEAARAETGPFVVGSSGVEYALVAAWCAAGLIGAPVDTAPLARTEAIAVVSGSCSPTTERQIRTACAAGFEAVAVDFAALAGGQGAEAAFEHAFGRAASALSDGRSPIVYTALGPDDVQQAAAGAEGDVVGRALGRILQRLLDEFGLDRAAVAGGDTSSHALSEIDVYALTLRRPVPGCPGSPVCSAHRSSMPDPFELALKGGQIGGDDFFVWLRDGDGAD